MRRLATLGLMATAIVNSSPAAAQDEGPTVEFYGTLLPFFENVGADGATSPVNFVTQTELLSAGNHTGINHDRRWRMTSGTSNLGFRGHFPIAADALKLIWQVESPAPIDGEGPSNWAGRNSHVGFSGFWGSLVYGNWDTPMRWATVTSVNPLKGGYTGDMTAIIGTPGHGVPAWNADQLFRAAYEVNVNPVGFFRHEPNSVQYWSPTIAGFSLRLMYSANEHRTAGLPGTEQPINAYIVSGSLGFDWEWLRIRYAAELHKDLYGTAIFGVGSNLDRPTSTDVGHLGLIALRFNRDTDYETRLVVVGDRLSYHTEVNPGIIGIINEFSRDAVYGLVHQKYKGHNLWLAYGQTTEGTCAITGGLQCRTIGLSASYPSGGYMYEFDKGVGIYAQAYYLINDISARYTPFPRLDSSTNSRPGAPNLNETSAGSDILGVGLGFIYSFEVGLLGGGGAAAEKVKEPPVETPAAPSPEEAEPAEVPAEEPEEELPAENAGGDPEQVELEEEPEADAPVE